ncbi:TrkA C-terminal domain protein [Limosilactobacillus coleohominis 101-4-CHN]|uniref:TrkA C-terminal domain protein n=1 Tax=Limosilactobacillus coleohominis 101-4-CHN TaxID=575594 RepID=C7XUF3_9LACO|nr:cation:proton antiporter family protein [Limosilactobacillus coleohominis]EEU30914.1 TrkA C-terminal domain protein [Limosilactobacillus coleohominis 101-4-CHN]
MARLSMFLVMLAALLIPILMARFKISGVPTAVAEIVMGILIGKSCFNIVQVTSDLTQLSSLGVIILMFLSGMEIDFDLFRPGNNNEEQRWSPVKLAGMAFVGTLINAFVLGLILRMTGLFDNVFLSVILFSTIALGVVIATLKEKEILSRPMGQTILLTAVLGEVVPMFALTVYASVNGGNGSRIWLIVLLLLAAIFLLRRFKQPYNWFTKVTKSTTHLDIRLAFFLIFTLVIIAETVGAENILGAFLAGMVMKLLEPSEATRDKLTSIGYGFFIPIFFIMTGVRLNLRTLLSNAQALLLIPILVLCFILAKFWAFPVYRLRFGRRNSFAGGFLTVTTITLVLPSLQVARNLHTITATQSDAFILAAVIVCIVAPIVFNSGYHLDREDLIRQRVVFLGTNVLTVPVAQQLQRNWFDVRMVTDDEKNYKTYNSQVDQLTYLPNLDEQCLTDGKFFDTDILVTGFRRDDKNFKFGHLAKENGVNRVIVAQVNRTVDEGQLATLSQAGVELFNPFNVEASVMRSLIESPAVYQMLTSTEAGLFEVRVRNHKYTDRPLMDLPFVDQITISRIRRGNKWIVPTGGTTINYNDHIIFTAKDIGTVATIRRELSKQN